MGTMNLIDMVRKRPGMFLGSNSISALRNFLDGYHTAELEYAIYRTGNFFPLSFQYMHEYTGYRLHDRSSMGWNGQILKVCNGAEDVALQKFFELYDGFVRVRMKRYWKAVLTGDNIAHNDQMKGGWGYSDPRRPGYTGLGLYEIDKLVREPIYRDPKAAYVMELTIPVYIYAVEAADDIRPEKHFFSSFENAQKSIENRLGPVSRWEEFTASNLSFDKNIVY